MINITHISSTQIFGAPYGCGTYGAQAYDEGEGCVTGAPSTSTPGGGLADTGSNVLIPLALGAALIIAAGILIVKRMVRRHRANRQLSQ